MNRPSIYLSLVAILVLGACGIQDSRLQTNDEADQADEAGSSESETGEFGLGEVHEFRFDGDGAEDGELRVDFEAGPDMLSQRIVTEQSFRSAKIQLTAPKLAVEYRVVFADGESTEWTGFEAEQSHHKFHAGFINVDRDAAELHFRADSPIEYARFEFIDEPIDTFDSIDDHGHDHDPETHEDGEATRRQAIAKSGRYQPSSSAQQAHNQHEGAFSYIGAGSSCSGGFLPGSGSLGDFLTRTFRGAAYYQGYNCRTIRGGSGLSMHGTGRAIDVFVPLYSGQADNTLGDPIANYLMTHADELGVQYFIWDRSKYNIGYGSGYYGGSHPHHDHLHIELIPSAANNARSNYPSPTGGPECTSDSQCSGAKVCVSNSCKLPPFDPQFADDDGSVHEQAINKLYEAGITRGCSGGDRPKYCPTRTVRRANMAVMFMRAFDLPRNGEDYFDDDDGSYAEPSINAMAYRGITMGCDPDQPRKFCPGEPVTRGQFALFLDRALRLDDTNRDFYSDDDGAIYEDAANRLAAAGITNGCAADRYCGSDPIDRGQLASFLTRALGLLPGYGTQEVDFVPHFADDDGSPHEESINLLYEAGIIHGCGGTAERPNYCPTDDLTRGALAKMSARGFDLPDATSDHFSDDDGSALEDDINAVAEAGLSHGCSDDEFCPNRSATLGEVAIFLIRGADHYSGGQIDADGMSQEDAIAELASWDAINRSSCDADPAQCVGDIVTRAQGAALFARVLSMIGAL